jgi:hypothetical protein
MDQLNLDVEGETESESGATIVIRNNSVFQLHVHLHSTAEQSSDKI